MLADFKLKNKVNANFESTKLWYAIFPLFLLLALILFILNKDSFSVQGYISLQKDLFFELNTLFSEFSEFQFNLTQFGDALISFSLLAIFIIYAPKIWGALATSGLFSLLISASLKKIFAIPRPAAVFDNSSFTIVGKTLKGATSLPSGHSITTFTVITILMFAFMPKNRTLKFLWIFLMILIGFFFSFSRVAVGAHYPLDVIIGSIIGFFIAILGIVVNQKINIWSWMQHKKYYPIFFVLLSICLFEIVNKILLNNLIIFYLAAVSIIVSLVLMINIYVKK